MQKLYQKNDLIEKIRAFLPNYPYVLKAELFGSYQSGEATENSDVDLIMAYDDIIRPRGFSSLTLERELEEKLGIKVDTCQEHLLHDFVEATIEKELIYEKA